MIIISIDISCMYQLSTVGGMRDWKQHACIHYSCGRRMLHLLYLCPRINYGLNMYHILVYMRPDPSCTHKMRLPQANCIDI